MLKIDRRRCSIGSSINTRTEKHGEDDVTALDIPLVKIGLTAAELPEVMLEKHAYELLYNTRKGRPDEPIWSRFHPLTFAQKIEGVNVWSYLGRKTLKRKGVTLAKVRIEPQIGGVTFLSVQVQCTPTLDDTIEALLGALNREVEVMIDAPHWGAQPDLPLESEPDPKTKREPATVEELFPPKGRRPRKDIDG